jgi:hypothetical protein
MDHLQVKRARDDRDSSGTQGKGQQRAALTKDGDEQNRVDTEDDD